MVLIGTRSVSMSVATIGARTYVFYFSLETLKLHFCLDDGSADSTIKINGEPITATKGNTSLAAVQCCGTEFRVYYEDNESHLAELIGIPNSVGGYTWATWRVQTKDGKMLRVMNKSAISATNTPHLRVFFVAPGGEVIYANCAEGWNSVVLSGGD